ncbi:MAG: DUF445 domain-containing protein [Acidimicrobiia bacterium]|nr:DUF445 domain-containing protein [Acidimicrobiia bacterium]
MALAKYEQDRATDLARMKRIATAFLGGATLIFLVSHSVGPDGGINGFVRAASEAAMVGGIADWFAVTALFRHPLGIPIPHTALIKRGKDQIGGTLGRFVQQNFLDPEILSSRLGEAGLSKRLGMWLVDERNSQAVARQAAAVIGSTVQAMRDDELAGSLDEAIATRIRAIPAAPLLGRILEIVLQGNHHHALFDAGLNGLDRALDANQDVLRRRLGQESPWWVPEAVDDVVFARVMEALHRFFGDLAADPDHELRRDVDTRARSMATDLQRSPDLIRRIDELKEELLQHPEFKAWSAGLWQKIKTGVIEATERPDSELRDRLAEAVRSAGGSLLVDEATQHRVDKWITTVVARIAEQSQDEIATFISSTVERWDATETSDRLELALGRDLQFVRINGTIFGGLVGIVIHLIVLLLG